MANPRFIKSVAANIAYWTTQSQDLQDETLPTLDLERENLFRAVEFGLRLPQTRAATGELALQSFLLIERRGYWREWNPLLQRLIATERNNHPRKNKLLMQLGQLQRLDRQLPAAVESHLMALNVAQKLADQQLVTRTWLNLSEDYRQLRQYREAEAYGIKALESFRASQAGARWRAATFNTLGLIAQSRGDLLLSEQRLRRAVDFWRQVNEPTELARSLTNLAQTLQGRRKFDQALESYREGATVVAQTTSELDKSLIQMSLGTLLFELEQWPEAETAFREANSDYLQHSAQHYYRAFIAQNLGNVLFTQQRFKEAEDHLRHGMKLWQQVDDKLMLANTVGTLAETFAAQALVKEARALFGQALTLLAPYYDDGLAKQLREEFEKQQLALGNEKR